MTTLPYNQMTRDYLKATGYRVGNVERWISHIKRRVDLFGIIDVIAISNERTVGVQSTSIDHRQDHFEKIYWSPVEDEDGKVIAKTPNENTKAWLQAGRELMLICWAKKKLVRGGKAFRYVPHIDFITKDMCVVEWNKANQHQSD